MTPPDPPRNLVRFERARALAVSLLDVGKYNPGVCLHAIFDLFYPENVEAWADVITTASVANRGPRPALEGEIAEVVVMLKILYFGLADHTRCPSWLLRGTEQCVHAILKRVLESVEGATDAVVDCAIDHILTLVGGFACSAPGYIAGMSRVHSLCLNLENNQESMLYLPHATTYTQPQLALLSRLARDVLTEESRDVDTWSCAFGHLAGSVALSTALERASVMGAANTNNLLTALALAKQTSHFQTPAPSVWSDAEAILASGASMIRTDDMFYPTGRLAQGGLLATAPEMPQRIPIVEPDRKKSVRGGCLRLDDLPSEITQLVASFVVEEALSTSHATMHALRSTSSSTRNAVDTAMLASIQRTLSIPHPPPPGPDGLKRTRLEIFLNSKHKDRRVLLEFPLAADPNTRAVQLQILLGWTTPVTAKPPKADASGSWIERGVRGAVPGGLPPKRRVPLAVLGAVGAVGPWQGLGRELESLARLNPGVSVE